MRRQRRRRLHYHDADKGDYRTHGGGKVAAACHLQEPVRHRRRVLPIRPAGMQDEVRSVDISRKLSKSACRH